MTIDNLGNVYVTGSAWDSTSTSVVEKIATIKYSTDGELIWVAKYGDTPVNKRGTAIAVDADGNVYTTGWIYGSPGPVSYISIKYDVTGQKQWDVIYNNNGLGGYATAIILDNQGNVYVTGYSSGGTTGHDYATIKYDPCGQQQWVARYSEPLNAFDIPQSIVVDDSGYVYVTGTSYNSTTFFDIVTIKYDQFGQQQWIRRYDDPGLAGSRDDCAFAVAVDKNRNVIITGGTQGTGSLGLPPEYYQDCVTIKYNPYGDTIWIRKYDSGRGGDWGTDLVLDNFDNIYVTGNGYGQSSSDYLTLKYNSDGQLQWDKYYNGPFYASGDYASAIAIDDEANLYLTGKSKAQFWDDFATLKYNSSGELQWVVKYDGPSNGIDQALSIAVDQAKNVYVFGKSKSGSVYDFLTIKYIQENIVSTTLISNSTAGSTSLDVASTVGFSVGDSIIINPGGPNEEMNKIIGFGSILLQSPLQYNHFTGESVVKLNPTDVKDDQNTVPTKFELYQNFPNPFNPSTKIKYTVPQDEKRETRNVTLKIYDVLGNEVATLVDEYKPAGTYEVEFGGHSDEGQNLTSGVYFYQIKAGEFSKTKKMIFLR
jgi:hypothetical protein